VDKIFVIDDSLSVCIAIERMLSGQGFEVTTARSGEQALDHLRRQRPDVIVCDLVLPDLDGTEICSYVREQPRLASTPVIAISGLVDAQVKAGAERSGAMRVIKKPFSSEDLLHAVHAALASRAAGGSGAEHDPAARVAAPPTAPTLDERELGYLVAEVSSLPSLRFGLIVRMDGRIESQFGEHRNQQLREVVPALVDLVRRSASAAEWLGQTDPHQLIFQADDGMILTQRYGDHLVVLVLADPIVLGKARFALARLRRRADQRAKTPIHSYEEAANDFQHDVR